MSGDGESKPGAKPGSRWRILARDGERSISLQDQGVFDELVIDDWLGGRRRRDGGWRDRLA
jgi:hypothetical protein